MFRNFRKLKKEIKLIKRKQRIDKLEKMLAEILANECCAECLKKAGYEYTRLSENS